MYRDLVNSSALVMLRRLNNVYYSENKDAFFVFNNEVPAARVGAHKLILCAESPVFYAMFYGLLREEGDVSITDAKSVEFIPFIQLIYQQMEVLSISIIRSVLRLADKYDCSGVTKTCVDFMKLSIDSDINKMCVIYDIAVEYKFSSVCEDCISHPSFKWSDLMESDAMSDASFETLSDFVKECPRCPGNEMIAFRTCMYWGRRSCIKKGIEHTPIKVRDELGNLFHEIKFYEMECEEFMSCEVEWPCFTFEEYKEIMRNIHIHCNDDNFMDRPDDSETDEDEVPNRPEGPINL